MDTTYLIRCLVHRPVPIEIRKSRAGAAKKSWDVFDKSKVPAIAFMESIKVHDVKLSDVDTFRDRFSFRWQHNGVGVIENRREEILPPSLEDAHARAVVPTFLPYPLQARRVALDDDMFYGLGILEICINLCGESKQR